MLLFIGFNTTILKDNFLSTLFTDAITTYDWYEVKKNKSRHKIKYEIFNMIDSNSYDAIIIMLNQDPLFYEEELFEISKSCKLIGIFTDDTHSPNYSMQISYYFDLVLTTDPTQVARYESLGITSQLHLLDVSSKIYKYTKIHKDIDILLYGSTGKNRLSRIKNLKSRFPQMNIVDITDTNLPQQDLVILLNRSKVTINWSSVSDYLMVNNYKDPLRLEYLQMKGRLLESALVGCVCLSDYVPELLKGVALRFNSESEMESLVDKLVSNPELFYSISMQHKNSASVYLRNLSKQIDINTIPKKIKKKLNNSDINSIVSTYIVIEIIEYFRYKKYRHAIENLKIVKFTKIDFRFLFLLILDYLNRSISR